MPPNNMKQNKTTAPPMCHALTVLFINLLHILRKSDPKRLPIVRRIVTADRLCSGSCAALLPDRPPASKRTV